MTRWCKISF